MKNILIIFSLVLLCSCGSKTPSDQSDTVISMQVVDRNGFSETISNKERISAFKNTDFLTPQPFQKVLRVYGRNAAGQSSSKITSYHENGQLWQYLEVVDGRAHGFYREWFQNGQQRIEASVVEGVADILDLAQATWVFEGPCKVWDDQGNLTAEFLYDKGLLHTPARYFFPSGKLHKIVPYEQGEIHGSEQAFDEEGNLLEETPYVQGEKQGKAIAYWEKGALLSDEMYEGGLLKEASYFDPKGQRIAEVKEGSGKMAQFKDGALNALFSISKGIIEGEMQFFRPDGSLHLTHVLQDGKKNGEEWEYYPPVDGKQPIPKLCLNWGDDKIQGQVKTWYPSGQKESQRELADNKKHGSAFAWYKNGDLMLMEEYESDLLIKGSYYKKGDKKAVSKIDAGKGVASLYNSDGIFLKKVTYEKGKPIPGNSDSLH